MNNRHQTIRIVLVISLTACLSAVYSFRVIREVCDVSVARLALKTGLLAAAISLGILFSVNTARKMFHGKVTWRDLLVMAESGFAIVLVKFFVLV